MGWREVPRGGGPRALVIAAAATALLLAPATATASVAAAPSVAVFPSPGDNVAQPRTQIAFRDLPYSELRAATITVTGSQSGPHAGQLEADSDGRGGSFLPKKPFADGETVTVTTSLKIIDGDGGTFHFTIANPTNPIPNAPRAVAPRSAGDVWHFRSAPELSPTAVAITQRSGRAAPGDIFIAPEGGPESWGPEIIDPSGHLVWAASVPAPDKVNSFQVQRYEGQRVLTWWEGNVNAACGRGVDVIYNSHYQQIQTVQAANGLMADLHEFTITPQNTALITSYYPVYWNATAVHGAKNQIVLDGEVQEIDIRTGLLLYQWDSLDHIPLTDAYIPGPKHAGHPWDSFHINSIVLQHDGNFVISSRNTWAVYKISGTTGNVIWTLGGKHSSFRLGRGASFAFQHDVRISRNDRTVTMFDDGGGPPTIHPSRALKLNLNFAAHTANVAAQYKMKPAQQANVEGDYQQLPDGHIFVGWGNAPYFSEFAPSGQQLFTGRLVGPNDTYRAYRFQWSGTPVTPPSVVASTHGKRTAIYVSWNGATNVAAWRVLSGSSPTSLKPVATAAKHGFETNVRIHAAHYVEVQALNAKHGVLGRSAIVHAG